MGRNVTNRGIQLTSKKRNTTDRGIQLTSFDPKNVMSQTRGPYRPFRCFDDKLWGPSQRVVTLFAFFAGIYSQPASSSRSNPDGSSAKFSSLLPQPGQMSSPLTFSSPASFPSRLWSSTPSSSWLWSSSSSSPRPWSKGLPAYPAHRRTRAQDQDSGSPP